ncbi:hypothetical protein [Novosphingobium sp. MMS21-SN21R]|uniref:hypothetical protein n=1 Tax=Novosphingobium sp. MMS21-SN21R TaxID=2969298 RepID=UPI0028875FEB|nr:hypothetical protein [Novosphingobium sp. MMS21-SN21R]MDT0507523.1 hypothetical protein [Novosphingobium sp. MMS21-SN21R]
MTQICVQSDFLLTLLTEVGKHRALADHETDIIEAIVCRGHKSTGLRIRWTATLDRKLWQASHSKGGISRFADANKIPRQGAYDRLLKLRKANEAIDRRKG